MTKLTYHLGLDQGSSSTKAVLINEKREIVFSDKIEIDTSYLSTTEVEQDPNIIKEAVLDCFNKAKTFCLNDKINISSIGLATQRSGVLAWERETKKPLHSLISWKDSRFKNDLSKLEENFDLIKNRTGLKAAASYAAPKIAWLQNQFPGSKHLVGTLDSFLLQTLMPEIDFITDDSHAARSMLYNLKSNSWDKELCALFEVDQKRLAHISSSIGAFGRSDQITIGASLGDQQAAYYAAVTYGLDALLNLGSLASLISLEDKASFDLKPYQQSVFYSECRDDSKTPSYKYISELTVPVAAMFEKLVSKGFLSSLTQLGSLEYELKTENPTCLYHKETDWQGPRSSAIEGWDGVSKEQIVIATLLNLACFIIYFLNQLRSDKNKTILVSGGLSKLDSLLQFIANGSGFTLARFSTGEVTSLGAALAGVGGAGIEIQDAKLKTRLFVPKTEVKSDFYSRWLKLKEEFANAKHKQTDIFD